MVIPLPDVVDDLRQIVGPRHVLYEPADLVAYECDALTHHRYQPQAVVFPGTTQEVSSVLALLESLDLPFIARGAGTGLSGGAVPVQGGVVVGLTRLNRILSIDAENRRAVVQPGVTNAGLSEATASYWLHYAPDPSSQKACTLGGNVAENAGGPHCLKYGVTTNHVLALEVVLPDGQVVELGGGAADPVGYDLVGLFTGSEGTFGIVTAITVRLTPNPQGVRTLLADFTSVDDASHTITAIIAAGIIPSALEMMDALTVQTVEDSVLAAGYPRDAAAVIVIELDGLEVGLDAQAALVSELCSEKGARSVELALDDAHRLKLWAGRKGAFGAVGRLNPDLLVQDAVVPRTKLPELVRNIYKVCDELDVRVSCLFHAGDGNLHPNISYDGRDPDVLVRVLEANRRIMMMSVEAGGTITGEHGVGMDKKDYMGLIFSEDALDAMRDAKQVFDPKGRCNPGKLIPDRASEPLESATSLSVEEVVAA